ncbi:efflux transporter outer membrane subunit [bacterium]|nr:efflux transporter outer membrane subunit [bacterium]
MTLRRLCFLILISGVFALTSSGCGYFQRHNAPKVEPMPETFLNARQSGAFDDTPWWFAFNDTTLNSLMTEAFASNLTIEQAAARLDQYRALSDVARATYFPSASVQGNIQEGERAMSGLPSGFKPTLPRYDASASASYEVDLWGKLSARRGAAYADFLASENDLLATVLSMSSQLTNSYFQAIEFRAQLELLEQTIQSYESYLELVRKRYSLGVAPSLDVYQAQIALAQARGQKILYEANVASAEHGLSVLLGRYPETNKIILSQILPDSLAEIQPGLPSELLQRRPDIRASYQRLRAADRRWAEAVANRFPSITLTSSAGANSNDLADIVDPEHIAWNIIGGITLPIFEGGKRKAEADRTEAVFRERAAAYKDVLLNAFREVEDALVRGVTQKQYVHELQAQELAAGNSLRLATDRYMQGVSDYLPVLQAQTNYYTARRSLITARRELASTRVNLVTALGGGWSEDIVEKYVTIHHTRSSENDD